MPVFQKVAREEWGGGGLEGVTDNCCSTSHEDGGVEVGRDGSQRELDYYGHYGNEHQAAPHTTGTGDNAGEEGGGGHEDFLFGAGKL